MPQDNRGWYDRGYLPHYDAADIDQSITFRLADSMPQHVLEDMERELSHLSEKEQDRERRRRIERYLDLGVGSCTLGIPEIAVLTEEAFLHGHLSRYNLLAWCVMPNHVHVAICQKAGWPLGDVVGSWKKYTARRANELLGRRGDYWYREYFDRYARDEAHLQRILRYVEDNPVKAGLCTIAQDWPWSSARFRREDGILVLPSHAALESGGPSS